MSDATPETTGETVPTESGARPDSILVGPGAAAAPATPAPARHRPISVTILAIGTGLLAALSIVHLLQALGIFPYVIGPFQVRAFSLFYAIMLGLMAWVWIWVTQMLWRVERGAWVFLAALALFNLSFDFILLIGSTTVSDIAASFLINGLILLYCMLPSTRRAFEIA